MSNTTLWIVVAVVVLAAAAAAVLLVPLWVTPTPPPVHIESLEDWVAFSLRPGFTPLDEKELGDYFIAVHRTEADELAFCYRWRGEGDAPGTSLAVLDAQGQELRDKARGNDTTVLNPTGPLPAGGFVDGMVFPIRPGYEGPVVLVFRDNQEQTAGAIPEREVYRQTVRWER